MNQGRYSDQEIESLTEEALRDGFCVLREHFSREKLQRWREAFQPLFDAHLAEQGDLQNRGSRRYYVTLPFEGVFADAEIYEDPDILRIVENLVGENFVMCQLATDTPLNGSEYQEIHRDAPPLFPEDTRETPMFQLAVNFSLVDVTPENGPFETTRGTHMMTKAEAVQKLESGERPIEQIIMKMGDVMIRDVRVLHRGTPNKTDEPRPMCVIGYSRKWLLRPEVSINIPRQTWETLTPNAKNMLRFNPIVESLEDAKTEKEVYQAFAF